MNDEQHRVARFGAQPEGPHAIFRLTALSFAHVARYTALIPPCQTEKWRVAVA